MLRISVPMLAAAAMVVFAAGHAQAGGVIIDGRAPGAPTPVPDNPFLADPGGNDSSTLAPNSQVEPLTPTEQQIFLWAATVLNGHDAATAPGAPPPGTGNIIDDLGPDAAMGGCRAAPPPSWVALVALLLLGRRRRA
jgi:MYXO-CTERM domain-containing protein